MPKHPIRSARIALLLAGSVGLLAQTAPLTLSPLNPDFLAWKQRKREQLQRLGQGQPVPQDSRFGYIPEPMAPLSVPEPAADRTKLMAPLPTRFDLRTEGALTAVRNQNPYGTCWAFSTFASLESGMLKAGLGAKDYSEWHLAWFARTPFAPGFPAFTKGAPGYGNDPVFDQGGNTPMSTAILSRGTGPVLETDRPYQHAKPYPSGSEPTGREPVQAHLRDALYLGLTFNATRAKECLMTHGALATPMYWEDNGATTFYNSTTHTYRRTATGSTNHLVNVVGWDDDYPKENFPEGNRPTANGAWIVRNSWGSGWGEGGYFYMSYDTYLHSAVAFKGQPQAPGRIYQYDPLGRVGFYGTSETASFGAVFTAEASENLKSVAFYAMMPGSTYEISVRTDVTGDPTTGTLAFGPQAGSLNEPGFRTLDLTTPVPLTAGQKFAVLVKLTTPGYTNPLSFEFVSSDYSDGATARPGETFFSLNGTTWQDSTTLNPTASACLKAIAEPAAAGNATFTAFAPASGAPGSTVTLSGSNLSGTTAVSFNGASASFVLSGASTILATVPSGATTGPIAITTPSGTLTSSQTFTVQASTIAVDITPKLARYLAGQAKQMSTTVTGTSNTAVTWSSVPAGLISATGLFTAPGTPGTVTLTATSVADAAKNATLTFPVIGANLDGAGAVDVLDLAMLCRHYGAHPSATPEAASCDLNGDDLVDDEDVALFLQVF